jgi:hypothetical protein
MITTFTDHDDCVPCETALADARVTARVTGSVGAQSTRDHTDIDGTIHRASWYRDGRDPRPVSDEPLTQADEDLIADLGYGGAL